MVIRAKQQAGWVERGRGRASDGVERSGGLFAWYGRLPTCELKRWAVRE